MQLLQNSNEVLAASVRTIGTQSGKSKLGNPDPSEARDNFSSIFCTGNLTQTDCQNHVIVGLEKDLVVCKRNVNVCFMCSCSFIFCGSGSSSFSQCRSGSSCLLNADPDPTFKKLLKISYGEVTLVKKNIKDYRY